MDDFPPPPPPPPRFSCTSCNGSGYIEIIADEICCTCAGTGKDTTSDLWTSPCKACNGSGRRHYSKRITCPRCNGSGELTC